MLRWLLLALLLPVAAHAGPRVVVLDPGHGGTNQGAFGPTVRRYEKELTLDLARRVRRYLAQWRDDLHVVLTRERDSYLTLDQRVRKANGLAASLFVSIHFNASKTRSQRGFETFILTREASAREAGRLALARTTGSGVDRGRRTVQAILADLRQAAAHGESARFARRVQRQLEKVRGAELDRGVRQAPFDVLLGLRMPGVLAEVGFIDHPTESVELVRPAALEGLAAALAAAVCEQLPREPGRGRGLARLAAPAR